MDYDLDRMGWRHFEHMVQSLALQHLGNGVQVFGDGVDSGRECTFDGPVQFPEGAKVLWSGYGVVQAKHHQFPGTPAENAAWLIAEIRKELGDFKPDKNGLTKRPKTPEYYLIASNVRLSGDEKTGGQKLVNDALEKHAKELGMKGFFIWHYANICQMLANDAAIRTTYAGFLTTGDVLARLINFLDGAPVNLGLQLRVHAGQQTLAKQWVRLGRVS